MHQTYQCLVYFFAMNGRKDRLVWFVSHKRKIWTELMNRENSDIIVAERDGIICGMACVDYVNKPETPFGNARCFYHVQEIAVDANHRQQGVAKELFEFLIADAKKRKLGKIDLDVWELKQRTSFAIIEQVTLNSCEGRYTMIGIYDCFGYGPGYTVSFEERYKLIRKAGFDCVMLWWSDQFGRGDG